MARPSKPLISRETAIAAALKVIDEKGLEGFSLQDIARELNAKAPSLYHHFRNKDDLLSEVAMSLLKAGDLPAIAPDPDWIEALVRISLSSWRSVLRHPKAATLLLRFMPQASMIGAYEHWAHYLAVNGVPVRLHRTIIDGTDTLTFGSIVFTAQRIVEGIEVFQPDRLERYPYLREARESEEMSDEARFATSIRCFVLGVMAHHRQDSAT